MNSERRHELQQNVLAGYLARINETIEPYSKLIAVVVGGLIVAAVAFALYQSSASGERSDATLQLIQAAGEDDAEVLAAVGDQYATTPAGAWARLYQGDELMSRGLRVLYSDRSEAEQLLGDAKTAYQQAISSSDERLLISRAHFGMARAAESLGNTEEAIQHYQDTIAANESEAMVEVAQQRIDSLRSEGTQDFITWFSEQDFSPADPALPPALPSGSSLPDLPDLDLPPLELPDLGDQPAPAEPAATEPAATEPAATEPEMTEETEAPASESEPTTPTGDESESTEVPPPPAPANEGSEPSEEPASEEPASEEPASEEPASEEPASEEPGSEEPAADDEAAPEPAAAADRSSP